MIRYIAFALGILIAGASNSATCRAKSEFMWPDNRYILILDEDALDRVKAKLTLDWEQYVVNMSKNYGLNAPEAIIEDRYPQYLIEIGCGNHVKGKTVVPVNDKVSMRRHEISEKLLKARCDAYFPEKWETNGGELFVKTVDGILRYRGLECALFKFK